MKHKHTPPPAAAQAFASELILLKDKAFRLGLYRTAHLIEIPIIEVGWEMQGESAPADQKQRQQETLVPYIVEYRR